MQNIKEKDRYQTVYAKYNGSAAAPTAGLHFTPELLKRIEEKGIKIANVTLHVGIGTFRPVKEENIEEHKMHTEHFYIKQEDVEKINETKKAGGRVIAVGTTSCRVLETIASEETGLVEATEGDTGIYIYPGYKFKCIDGLITNFHLPKSTLLMLVSALAGSFPKEEKMNEPLAYRVRPKTLEEYVGQEHVLGKDKILYRTIKADRLSSLILFGPPGCGKTSLAQVISETTKYKFYKINAVTAGVADIKAVIEETKNFMLNPAGKAILFIDEIHRFNKLQQDALLPYVENGTIILIGATTENPYFEVNKALISRSMVVKLEPLTQDDIFKVLKMALTKKEGLGEYNIKIEDETLEKLSNISGGDVRTALNALEIATLTTSMNENGEIVITDEILQNCVQTKKAVFDKSGDSHYDNISAFIKSMRMFLARRIVICASEDVGLANPNALVVANSAMQAVHMVGMPEARIILAEAAVYVANSKKSNATYLGIDKALEDVSSKDTGTIPMHIRNAPVEGMKNLGYSIGYKYPHDFPGHVVEQQYLPDKMLGTKYFVPDENVKNIE